MLRLDLCASASDVVVEEAGLSQAEAMLSAVPLLRWRAWAGHCGVLRARRRAFVQVNTQILGYYAPFYCCMAGCAWL